ncbi:MAG: acyltransferase [Proteobacteria bacterium]|nr:acyltransferase [Pseudomonadota bacterium]
MTAAAPSARENAPGGQIETIQALRAIAALLVVFGHAAHETEAIGPRVGLPAIDASFMHWGIGVDIFFVISGFIMVHTSADLFGQPGAWRVFLARRIARIVPLYWLLTSVLLIGGLIAPRLLNVPLGDWQHILASYLFVPSLRGGDEIRPVMALGWTLNLEMFFYVLFAGAMLLPLRRGMIALALVISGLALAGALLKPAQVQLAFWTQQIILEFLFGCLLALVYRQGIRLPAASAVLLVALGFAGMVKFLGLDGQETFPPALRWGLPAALIVGGAALYRGAPPRLALLLTGLGNASYSLYLFHPFALRPLREVWVRLVGGALPLELYIALAMTAATLTSVLLYRCVERPIGRWARFPSATAGPRGAGSTQTESAQPLPLRTTT